MAPGGARGGEDSRPLAPFGTGELQRVGARGGAPLGARFLLSERAFGRAAVLTSLYTALYTDSLTLTTYDAQARDHRAQA